MTIWGLVLLVIVADTAGNLCLARGMRRGRVLGFVALGVACMTVSFSAFAILLSWKDLSFALPATAAGYVLNTLGAAGLLKEPVTPRRWLGTALIGLGVALVSLTA